MRIKIAFYSEKLSWNKKWIFLGSSFEKLKIAEKKITGPRIKVNNFLHKSFDEELKNYLEWTEKERNFFNDNLNWWMTEIAGRNNINSNFVSYICQIKSLKKILKEVSEDDFLIVSDDILLIKTIIENIKYKTLEKSILIRLINLQNLFNHYFKFIRSIFVSIVDMIFSFFSAKITLKKKFKPKGNIYLVHKFAAVNSLRSSKKSESRYVPYLKEYFLKEKIACYFLTWSPPFLSGKIKAFNNIRAENCFVPEDWLSFFDYIISIKNFLKVRKYFNTKSEYPDVDIRHLILREKRSYLEQMHFNIKFWYYFPALKKWSKYCDSLVCIDHYENMSFEHALIAAVKDLSIKTKTIGYHHTLSSREFTAWHSLKSEWSSKFKPDYVMSLGSVSTRMLTKQGIPNERIIEGPALRYNNLLTNKKNINEDKKKNYILIPLPAIKDASIELITAAIRLSKEMTSNSFYHFVIKPHPNLDINKILNKYELNKIPKNISISDESIDKLFNSCLFTILMSTGAVYDAIMNGNIVLNLRRELQLADNYLDLFAKDFKFVDSYSLNSMKNILIEFAKDDKKIQEYQIELEKLRKYLIKGMNIVSESTLSKFKLN